MDVIITCTYQEIFEIFESNQVYWTLSRIPHSHLPGDFLFLKIRDLNLDLRNHIIGYAIRENGPFLREDMFNTIAIRSIEPIGWGGQNRIRRDTNFPEIEYADLCLNCGRRSREWQFPINSYICRVCGQPLIRQRIQSH